MPVKLLLGAAGKDAEPVLIPKYHIKLNHVTD
jgi:hypothetical protein